MDILKYGNEYQIRGVLFGKHKDESELLMLPDEDQSPDMMIIKTMDLNTWQDIIRQTDLLEVQVVDPNDKNKKVIARKSQRQIDQQIAWKVFKRDGYKCRYCGTDHGPLTVDHLVLWEEGGPSLEENLVSACKKCNRTRGNTPYVEWLSSDYYQQRSKGLDKKVIDENTALMFKLSKIPTNNKRSR